jgi:ubiquitin C-terminal hydrolase
MDNKYINSNENNTIIGVCKYINMDGVTCYMNSVLHILQQLPIFTIYISQCKFRETLIKKAKYNILAHQDLKITKFIKKFVIYELFRLFKTSLENDDKCITPIKFKKLIGEKNDMWNEHNQQDSQEFCNFLISQIKEEAGVKCEFIPGLLFNLDINSSLDETIHPTSGFLPQKALPFDETSSFFLKKKDDITLGEILSPDEPLRKNTVFSKDFLKNESLSHIIAMNYWTSFQYREYSPLNNMFDGLMETSKKCMYCKTTNVNYDPYLTLGLSIPIKNNITLYDCLDYLTAEEQLDNENKITCNFCGLLNKSFTKSLFWKTPKILILHIKRFFGNLQKNTTNITYPYDNLDLSKYFTNTSPYKNDSKYDLIGINIHHTLTQRHNINSGHYTSMIKNMCNNNWYFYNDSENVQQIYKKKDLQNSNAYMLFYYRND